MARITRNSKAAGQNSNQIESQSSSIETKRKILFIKDEIIKESKEDVKIQKIEHPGTGKDAFFILSQDQKQLYEVFQYDEPQRSWFIDQSVCSDGRIYITVPIDMLFVVLHFVKNNCFDRAIPFNNWHENKNPLITAIFDEVSKNDAISAILDVQKAGDLIAYKYNKKKTMAWLSLKAKKLAQVLKQQDILKQSSQNADLEGENTAAERESEYLNLACRIIGNYVDLETLEELLNLYPLAENNAHKRKSLTVLEENLSKKVKLETSVTAPKSAKISTKAKALTKAAAGSKNIMSFFKK